MFSVILTFVAVLFAGSALSERLRVRQEEEILKKLSTAQAAAYYDQLKGRVRKTRSLQALSLVGVVLLLYAYRRLWPN